MRTYVNHYNIFLFSFGKYFIQQDQPNRKVRETIISSVIKEENFKLHFRNLFHKHINEKKASLKTNKQRISSCLCDMSPQDVGDYSPPQPRVPYRY